MRLSELLTWGKETLSTLPYSDSDIDCELFLEYITGIKRLELFLRDRECTEKEEKDFRIFVQKRLEHEPFSYIAGFKNFYGYDFTVNRNVLIPRFETEILIEKTLPFIDNKKVLDLCCGSGCIGITLFLEGNPESVLLTDISRKALDTARLNIDRLVSKNKEKITTLCSDMFRNINSVFDIIVSNPPYISASDHSELLPAVRDYEPECALTDNSDGLTFYREIQQNISDYLKKDGMLIMEIGHDQKDAVYGMFSEIFGEVTIINDYSDLPRIAVCKNLL